MRSPSYNPALHCVALLTSAATFPLVFMGGLVTTKGAGMSVPDWPNTYGYNMFLFPPNQWVGGILYEHTHRLMATVVGFLSVVLTLVAWGPAAKPAVRRALGASALVTAALAMLSAFMLPIVGRLQDPNSAHAYAVTSHFFVAALGTMLVLVVAWLCRAPASRRWVRWLCTGVLGAVLVQGTLGGLRVILVQLDLAIVHACFAQAFFCLASLAALVTSKTWDRLPQAAPRVANAGLAVERRWSNLSRWAVVAVAAVYVQLMVGATMRHYEAGLAIPDVPLHYGKILPPTTDADLDAANLWRAKSGEPELRRVTLSQVWLHVGHRAGAVLVSCVLLVLIAKSLRGNRSPGERLAARTPARLLIGLLATQLTLGILTVLLRKPADIASLHVAVGALLLVTTFLLAARSMRAGAVIEPDGVTGLERRGFAVNALNAGRPAPDRQNGPTVVLTR